MLFFYFSTSEMDVHMGGVWYYIDTSRIRVSKHRSLNLLLKIAWGKRRSPRWVKKENARNRYLARDTGRIWEVYDITGSGCNLTAEVIKRRRLKFKHTGRVLCQKVNAAEALVAEQYFQ